jgi:hypothetical protein
MAENNILKTYETINDSNQKLRDKKNELEFILNRYHQVISKINAEDIKDREERILIQTVQEVFKKGEGDINNLIDTYLNNLI